MKTQLLQELYDLLDEFLNRPNHVPLPNVIDKIYRESDSIPKEKTLPGYVDKADFGLHYARQLDKLRALGKDTEKTAQREQLRKSLEKWKTKINESGSYFWKKGIPIYRTPRL